MLVWIKRLRGKNIYDRKVSIFDTNLKEGKYLPSIPKGQKWAWNVYFTWKYIIQ